MASFYSGANEQNQWLHILSPLSFEAEASGLEVFLEAVCWDSQKPCGYHINDGETAISPMWLQV